jgi:excisionase family DNA binding protein
MAIKEIKENQKAVSASQAARILGLSPAAVIKYIGNGKIKANRLGARWIIPMTEVNRLLTV